LAPRQGYYRRGDANFALGKFKEAIKDFRTVGGGGGDDGDGGDDDAGGSVGYEARS